MRLASSFTRVQVFFAVNVLICFVTTKAIAVDIFSTESTELVDVYAQAIQLYDEDSDGIITNSDFVSWLIVQSWQTNLEDFNLDGEINAEDVKIQLVAILYGLAADFDGDLVVSVEDFEVVNSNVGKTDCGIVSGDINADSTVNAEDLLFVVSRLGQSYDLLAEEVAEALLAETFAEVILADHAVYFTSLYPEGYPSNFPPNHDPFVSNGWYTPPAPHNTTYSPKSWPANHYRDLSTTWNEAPEYHSLHNTKLTWPLNHHRDVSIEWPGRSSPIPHLVDTSRLWPGGHHVENSGVLDHYHIYSSLEPSDPEWTDPLYFPIYRPSPHQELISSTWEPSHQVMSSRSLYPPSHALVASQSWPNAHAFYYSAGWPANHYGGLSISWPQPDPGEAIHPNWPANHIITISNGWSTPVPTIPWFPPNHSIVATALQIVPLLPEPQEPATDPEGG